MDALADSIGFLNGGTEVDGKSNIFENCFTIIGFTIMNTTMLNLLISRIGDSYDRW